MSCEYSYFTKSLELEPCGLPTDPKSKKLTGKDLCEYHLEQELKESM